MTESSVEARGDGKAMLRRGYDAPPGEEQVLPHPWVVNAECGTVREAWDFAANVRVREE